MTDPRRTALDRSLADLERYDPHLPLGRASALPPSLYTDPAFLERERTALFGRTWQLAGRTDRVAAPGCYFTSEIAGEPIVVVRGHDEALRGFYNVCRHRAGPPATGAGCTKAFRCAYHGWTYDLDGRLRGTPEFAGVERFDRDEYGLVPVAVESWGPLLLVNLDRGAPPLARFTEDLDERLTRVGWATMRFARRVSYEIDSNWKVYVENYLEGYHIPHVHPGLHKLLDYPRYRTQTRTWHSIQHSPTRPVPEELARYARYTGEETLYAWIFPNLMLNVYRDVFSTNVILPLSPHRTVIHFDFFFRDLEGAEHSGYVEESVAVSDAIQAEDAGICERVQKGLTSRAYRPGRLSVAREAGVHHFQTLLARWIRAHWEGARAISARRPPAAPRPRRGAPPPRPGLPRGRHPDPSPRRRARPRP